MQVTETLAEGLKREYRVVVASADLDAKANARLEDLKGRVRINGFRPGKVPVSHLKRVYGRAVMAETIDEVVRETNASIVSDHGFKLAREPKVTLPAAEAEVNAVVEGKTDLSYSVAIEILPKIELADFSTISLERLTAPVTDEDVDAAVNRLAEQSRPFADKGEGAKAATGDKVTVSFTGTIDGKPFEGGTGEDIAVELGSNSFIPGFEEQLAGIVAGETRTVKATFPENYLSRDLAGKEAIFEVVAKSVTAPGTVAIDDAFAKSLGMESLDKLKEALKERITREHAAESRRKVKRKLLDALDERHRFELPPTLVEEEFENVWRTVISDLEAQKKTFADENTTEEAARAEYRGIAERRVRLGLVLAEIGAKNDIKVTDDELSRAVVERARQFPGQEQRIWEYYRKSPEATASLRAPLYEDKVVDFLLELVKSSEKTVSRADLYRDEDEEKAA
ncbi:MAG TPA: trigger factor [Xanthobacteraceae bacterium]|jgi:trigger factor|nr:trigger factor [Xanthobacteraceae bacterium]